MPGAVRPDRSVVISSRAGLVGAASTTPAPASCVILRVMSLLRWSLWMTLAGLAAGGAIAAAATWLRPDPKPCLNVLIGTAACAAPHASMVVVDGGGILAATACFYWRFWWAGSSSR